MTGRAAPERVLVVNPGANPETQHVATALARVGRLHAYAAPFAVRPASASRVEGLGPPGRRAAVELRRRLAPAGVDDGAIRRIGTATEVLRVGAARIRLPTRAQFALAEAVHDRFDARAAASIDGDADALVAVQGSALRTLRRAAELGKRTILSATVAHPRLVAEIVAQERASRPQEADRLRGDQPPPSWARRRLPELAEAETILVPSSFARDSYLAEGVPASRLVVAPLGVDTAAFAPAAEPRTDGAFRVMFAGRITQLKGVGYLIAAFLKAGIPRSELLLVGDAGRARLSDPQQGIRHVPPVPRHELAALFRSSDVFVLPTLADSFGLVLLEAMATGIPVIATPSSIAADIVEDGANGFLAGTRDVDGLAARLATLAGDPDLRRSMGSAGRVQAEAMSWDRYERRVLAIVGGADT